MQFSAFRNLKSSSDSIFKQETLWTTCRCLWFAFCDLLWIERV